MAHKIQLRGDTLTNWTSANPVLWVNEPAIETNDGKFKMKVGDGVNEYLDLPYLAGEGGLSGTNYVFVQGNGTPSENAAELQAVYDLAKTMSPNSGNTVTVVVAPGTYTFGENAFIVDTPYINIVSLTGNPDAAVSSNENDFDDGLIGVRVTTNNILLKGIKVIGCFFIGNNLDNLICENCEGGDYSFGGTAISSTVVSGTFNNCTGGVDSFGGGGGGYNTASGTFNNCIGGLGSFGGNGGTASGIYENCTGGIYSFGGIASGTFTNCTGGDSSFGGGDYGVLSSIARLYYCRLTSGTFKTPQTGGKIVACIDGNDDFIMIS